MEAAVAEPRLAVSDIEFVPSRPYAAIHGCGDIIIGEGTTMRQKMDRHTAECSWMEPTA